MTMTPDDLRALADALSSGTHYVESPELHETMMRAATYLRAQAEAQPVAWRCEVRGDGTDPKLGAVDWRHYHTTTSKREAQAFVARCGNGIEGRVVPLYAHPAPAAPEIKERGPWTERHTSAQVWIEEADQAHDLRLYVSGIMESNDQRIAYAQEIARRLNAAPTAPQAEPKRPAFLDEIDRAKEHVASWPQWMKDATVSAAATLPVTEPKREALRGLAPTHRCPACGAFWRQCDDASWNLRSASCCGLCDAGRVELVCWLDEPKREPLSDERIDEIGDPFGYFQYGDAQGDKRRAFARAVERAAYERAAQECELQITGSDYHFFATHGHWDHMAQAATNCAAAIRALGRQHD